MSGERSFGGQQDNEIYILLPLPSHINNFSSRITFGREDEIALDDLPPILHLGQVSLLIARPSNLVEHPPCHRPELVTLVPEVDQDPLRDKVLAHAPKAAPLSQWVEGLCVPGRKCLNSLDGRKWWVTT